MKYKLIIFDLDGTLLNTLEDLKISANYALEKYNLNKISLEDTRNFIGNGIRNLLIQASNNNENIDAIVKIFKEYYSLHYNDFTTKYYEIDKVLIELKNRGYILGVLTNKVEDIAVKLIEEHFNGIFDFVYGEADNRLKKPDPTFLLEIINNYNLNTRDVLYIGDSDVDVKTTINANITGLFVAYGYRDKNKLISLSDNLIDFPIEILKFLEEK